MFTWMLRNLATLLRWVHTRYYTQYIYRYNVQGRKTSSQSRTFAQRLAILERGVLDVLSGNYVMYYLLWSLFELKKTLHPGVMILA